jgi:hypothetical protein
MLAGGRAAHAPAAEKGAINSAVKKTCDFIESEILDWDLYFPFGCRSDPPRVTPPMLAASFAGFHPLGRRESGFTSRPDIRYPSRESGSIVVYQPRAGPLADRPSPKKVRLIDCPLGLLQQAMPFPSQIAQKYRLMERPEAF